MERRRNWLGLAALALASLALVISLGALSGAWRTRPAATVAQTPPVTFIAPGPGGRFEDLRGNPPPPFAAPRWKHHAEGHHFAPHPGGFFWPWLGFAFKLLQALTQLAALVLLAWLLLRLFQQGRNNQPPAGPSAPAGPPAPAGPTTPAGHDPRVE
ncbi:MAG: hypothetical protein RMK84_08525 [Oscillochloridaceae bacterium]|nr:hypothetical protein [Chloroflexaceae bacterium]MDW8390155.1 hypothetical protein [Oscillochloridaceae bacterium]